jgi:hypothetical protein
MREIRTSGLMSGGRKRIAQSTLRLSSTLPVLFGKIWTEVWIGSRGDVGGGLML